MREVVTVPGKDPSTITIRDAEKALAVRKAEIAQGKFDILSTQKQVKFHALVEDYLEWAKDNHRDYIRDESIAKTLLSHFKNKSVSDMKLWDIEKYKSWRKKLGRQPETINRELTVLRRMLKLAEKGALEHDIIKNPIEGLQLVKVPKKKYRTLSYEEFKLLYDSAIEHLKPILLCAYFTGMRRGEILKLKWEHVDLKEGYIYVIESKNDEYRSIPLGNTLIRTLENLKAQSSSDYVFTTQEGKPYTSKKAWDGAFKKALKRSGIKKCTFHELRHTFVSNLIVNEKEDYATVMAISGHKDIRMLQRYSHTNEEAKKAAIKKLGDRIKDVNLTSIHEIRKV